MNPPLDFDFSLEPYEVEQLARLVAVSLASQPIMVPTVKPPTLDVASIDVNETVDVWELKIDLEALVSGVAGIQDPIGQLRKFLEEWFKKIIEGVANAVEGIFKPIFKTIKDMLTGLTDSVSKIADTIKDVVVQPILDALKWVQDVLPMLGDLVSKLIDKIYDAFAQIKRGVEDVVGSVKDALGKVVDTLKSILEDLSKVPEVIADLLRKVEETITGLLSKLTDIASSISEALSKALEALSKVPEVVSKLVKDIEGAVGKALDALADLGKRLTELGSSLIDKLSEALKTAESIATVIDKALESAVARARAMLDKLVSGIVDQLTGMADKISKALADAVKTATKLPELITDAIKALQDATASMLDRLTDAIGSAVKAVSKIPDVVNGVIKTVTDFVKRLPSYAVEAIENVEEWVFEHLPGWVKRFLEQAPRALDRVGVALTGFINAILKFPEWFPNWYYEKIAKPITEAIRSLSAWFWDEFVKRVVSGLAWVGEHVTRGLETIWGWTIGAVKWVAREAVGFAKSVWNVLVDTGKAVTEFMRGEFKTLYETLVEKPLAALATEFSEALRSSVETVLKSRGKLGEISMLPLILAKLAVPIGLVMLPYYVVAGLDDMIDKIEASLEPMGVGTKVKVKVLSMLKRTLELVRDASKEMLTGMMVGMGLAVFDPLRYVLRPSAKTLLTPVFKDVFGIDAFFELPSEGVIKELMRRRLAAGEKEEQVFNVVKTVLEIRGLPMELMQYYVKTSKEWNITVHDRWGAERKWPLSPIYEFPTVSELATFMIKDMFGKPEDFVKAMMARGVPRDIALFFYLNHFRYPSVEKLAEFYWRGVAGELWNPDNSIDKTAAELFGLPADKVRASAPKELNFEVAELYNIISTYLKWQDYARLPWKTGFPTDNAIVMELLTDVPGKIDLRWMAKWGIFDYWSKFDITTKTSIEEITVKKLGGGVFTKPVSFAEELKKAEIVMDVRQFCRMLQAVGLHPYWVPWVAIAETINALTEERTLLRTGFINLFKEGFWTKDDLDQLLGGFFNVTFKVSYLDFSRGLDKAEWKDAEVTLPVAFLPAESKLLELRATMDRALDILRDMVKELNRAYAENIVTTIDDYRKLLTGAVSILNNWFKETMKTITGKEFELKVDSAYYDTYAKVLELYRSIYTLHRIRYWVGRIIGWAIYRAAYGYVTKEDIEALVEAFADVAKLTDAEKQVIINIAEKLVGVARKEYIPTPAQMATIVEVVPEAVKFVDKVLEARRVPEEWRPIWRKYIEVKPIVDDVRRLMTAYAKALRYGLDLGDIEKRVLEIAKEAGWTDRELEIMKLRVDIETLIDEWREARKEYIPTPLTLASMAEIIPEVVKFAEEVFEKRRVPKEWREIWLKYINAKPIADDVRRLMTAYARALRYGVPLGELEKRILELARETGWTDREIEILKLRATVEALVDEHKEYIPTPSMLATIAEIVPEVRKLAGEVLEKRRVPEEWRGIWLKYIQLKPIVDEARRLLSAYERLYQYGVIDDKTFESVLKWLRRFGYEDEEVELIKRRAELERAYTAWRELVGTPRSLVTMAEYSPTARNMALAVVHKMIDALPIDARTKEFLKRMWEEYIRVKPVYDEVRRYVTELISDYAEGVIDDRELLAELNDLKKWGLSDNEIAFYYELAKKRRRRYWARRGHRR